MIVIETLYLIGGLLLLFILVSFVLKWYESRKLKKDVEQLWDKRTPLESSDSLYVSFHNYFVNIMEHEDTDERNIVDDETWNDLDVSQLMKKINFSFTTIGDEILYAALRNSLAEGTIKEDFIEKIKNDTKYRKEISYKLAKLGRAGNSDTSKFMYETIPNKTYQPLFLILSLLPIIGVFLFFVNPLLSFSTILIGLGANAYFSMKHKNATGLEYRDIFYAISIIITAGKMDSKYNRSGLRRLSFLSPLFINEDQVKELNIAVQLFTSFKLLFLIDYHLYHMIYKTINKHHALYKEAWHHVADIDLHYSIAMWRETLPYYSEPIKQVDTHLTTDELYHPLIDDAVDNALDFTEDILLTGSNAAGKSTFMKAIGLNIIMSNGLHTSTSKYFKYTPGKVISSMDISDSVIDGDSYFISEVKSLKRIIDEIEDFEGIVYCIIDEIFKGTNTIERLAAGEALLRYLHDKDNVNLIVATHDLELTELLSEEMAFYHFSESMLEDDVYFDYKIKDGVAKTSNAIELLRLHDFPDEIYTASRQKVDKQVGVK